MNILSINGVIVPTITFFDQDFTIDNKLNSLLYKHILLNDANALFLFGTTGEGLIFTDKIEKKIQLIKTCKETVQSKVPILVGVFGNSVNEVLDEMKELGAIYKDIGFVIPPPYKYKILKEEMGPYFENILGSTELNNPIYLYNNPTLFKDVDIPSKVFYKLINFPNLRGVKDSTDKINKYMDYLNFLGDNFSIYCGKEGMFSTFLQLVPTELRNFCGLVPSIGNISNICAKLYNSALKENTLEIVRLQEELDEYRNKIYDIQLKYGKQQRGLKSAFYSIYKDYISSEFTEVVNVSPEIQRPFEDFTYDRIKVTVRYLTNINYINRFYPIKDTLYTFNDFKEKFSHLLHLGPITRIKGGYSGKINAIYRIKFEQEDIVFRNRISQAFRYEDIAKEKLLYPFLDNTLNMETPDLRKKIEEILATKTGSYIFNSQRPSIVNVGNLIYYDETKQVFPDIYTLHEYIHGKPLYYIIDQYKSENKNFNNSKFLNLFNELGQVLGKLHSIKFDCFYEKVSDIGKSIKINCLDRIKMELDYELQEAKKNKVVHTKEIQDYFKDKISLIEEEDEPILFHNDFHGQNIIVKEDQGIIQFKGLIDFDNWQIGARPMDFVKLEFLTLKPLKEQALSNAFYRGYVDQAKVNVDKRFKEKVEIFSLLWFLKVYNFERDKIRKGEQNLKVDRRFPSAEIYLSEINKILGL